MQIYQLIIDNDKYTILLSSEGEGGRKLDNPIDATTWGKMHADDCIHLGF